MDLGTGLAATQLEVNIKESSAQKTQFTFMHLGTVRIEATTILTTCIKLVRLIQYQLNYLTAARLSLMESYAALQRKGIFFLCMISLVFESDTRSHRAEAPRGLAGSARPL